MDYASSARAVENNGKVERGYREVICDAPMTFQGYGIELNRIQGVSNIRGSFSLFFF